jgi:uncharacterized cupin superfamily protein
METGKKPIINLADVPLRENRHGETFVAQVGRIGSLIGAKKLGCQLYVVPAGRKAVPRHAHHVNEEMFFVLNGSGLYRVGDETYPIREGDLIAAPAGDVTTAHHIVNTSDAELRYLAFSTRLDPDVCEYPDSGKFLVGSMVPEDTGLLGAKLSYVGRVGNSLKYWDNEE